MTIKTVSDIIQETLQDCMFLTKEEADLKLESVLGGYFPKYEFLQQTTLQGSVYSGNIYYRSKFDEPFQSIYFSAGPSDFASIQAVEKAINPVKKQLTVLLDYLNQTHQVGHTTSMLNGAKNSDCLVVTQNHHHTKHLEKEHNDVNFISLSSLEQSLKGHRKPILLDNATMHVIFQSALNEITRLEQKILTIKGKIRDIVDE